MTTSMSIRVVCLLLIASLIGCGEQESAPSVPQTTDASIIRDTPKGLDFEFYKESIEPIFIRYRGGFVGSDTACVACHTVQANAPLGLLPLTQENGDVFWTEEQSRTNMENVALLVNPGTPETSRILMAPLAPTGGGEAHSGGIFWDSTDHSEYRLIAQWIATGNPNAGAEPSVDVDFEFFRACVQPIFVNPIENAMPCTECHSGQFAIPNPDNSYWTLEQSRQSFQELMTFVDPGRPDYSRFLHKPLHPNEGGDLMHNGGRRWYSKDDPERVALEDWVRGDSVGDQCPPALQFDFPPRS